MKGKDLCEILKSIRKKIADANGIDYEPHPCNHEGACLGTCPMCDAELQYLRDELKKKGADAKYDLSSDEDFLAWLKEKGGCCSHEDDPIDDAEQKHIMGGPIRSMDAFLEEPQAKPEKKSDEDDFPLEMTLGVIVDPYSDPPKPSFQ